jgi:hypothetical protein
MFGKNKNMGESDKKKKKKEIDVFSSSRIIDSYV